MAERRMFAKTIIDSDAFLDMPLSAQALYFHLSMRADDDGFINNPRNIQRTIGCGKDDLMLLFAKKFVIPFDSGIVVIKHWKIHNYIQKDRYKPTVYQEEKKQLDFKPNKAYTLKTPEEIAEELAQNGTETPCIQDVSNSDTQVRSGKVRSGKVSLELGKSSLELGKSSLEGGEDPEEPAPPLPAPPPAEVKVNCQEVVDLYNKICTSLPSVRELSDARRLAITARVKKYGLEKIVTVFQSAEASSFLKGNNDRSWAANFDWLMEEANMVKVLEGNYVDRPKRYGRQEPTPQWTLTDTEREAIQRMMAESLENGEDEKTVGNDPELAERAEKLKQELTGGPAPE